MWKCLSHSQKELTPTEQPKIHEKIHKNKNSQNKCDYKIIQTKKKILEESERNGKKNLKLLLSSLIACYSSIHLDISIEWLEKTYFSVLKIVRKKWKIY